MKQTEQYGLNQWELTDRILMSDFNADNAKIAAALAGKMGRFERLYSDFWEDSYPAFSITSHVSNWNEVDLLLYSFHTTFSPFESSTKLRITLDHKNGQTNEPVEAALLDPADTLLVLFPLCDENRLVEGIAIGGGTKVFQMTFPFNKLGSMGFRCVNSSGVSFQRTTHSLFRVR